MSNYCAFGDSRRDIMTNYCVFRESRRGIMTNFVYLEIPGGV